MLKFKMLILPTLALSLMLNVGCESNTSKSSAINKNQTSMIQRLTEEEIAKQEMVAEKARINFYNGNYDQVPKLLDPFCEKPTTNQPLYLCEVGTSYLAQNNKTAAQKCLLEAYTSLEGFFDTKSEKKAVSYWGAEAEKVYKGDPYEQATLSLFTGLLFLENGEIDNALACFKNGQLADSMSNIEQTQSDYGLLQCMEAKCYEMRNEPDNQKQFETLAKNSFAKSHPYIRAMRTSMIAKKKAEIKKNQEQQKKSKSKKNQEPILDIDYEKLNKLEDKIVHGYRSYYGPLMKPYNTLVLVWIGRSPEMQRQGRYGETRIFIKNPTPETHFEVLLNESSWHDVIHGFSNIDYQATTRNGREMDNVLANQAAFKKGTHDMANVFFEAAKDAEGYGALILLGAGLIAEGISQATNVKADIRCWKTLPENLGVIPLQLLPGQHQIQLDCYDVSLNHSRSIQYEINVDDKPFQFFNLVIPTMDAIDIPSDSNISNPYEIDI